MVVPGLRVSEGTVLARTATEDVASSGTGGALAIYGGLRITL